MFSSLVSALALSILGFSTIYLWWKSKAETRLENAAYWALLPIGPIFAMNLSRHGYSEAIFGSIAVLIIIAPIFALIGSLIKPKANNKIKDRVFIHSSTENVSQSPMSKEQKSNDSKTWHYIAAWLVFSILGSFLSLLFDSLYSIATNYPLSESSLIFYYFFMVLTTAPAFIITYGLIFKKLKSEKVLPWLYILGTLGALAFIGALSENAHRNNFDHDVLHKVYLTILFSWAFTVSIIRNQIKKHWHTRSALLTPAHDNPKQPKISPNEVLKYRPELMPIHSELEKNNAVAIPVFLDAISANPRISTHEIQQLISSNDNAIPNSIRQNTRAAIIYKELLSISVDAANEFEAAIETYGDTIDLDRTASIIRSQFPESKESSNKPENDDAAIIINTIDQQYSTLFSNVPADFRDAVLLQIKSELRHGDIYNYYWDQSKFESPENIKKAAQLYAQKRIKKIVAERLFEKEDQSTEISNQEDLQQTPKRLPEPLKGTQPDDDSKPLAYVFFGGLIFIGLYLLNQ